MNTKTSKQLFVFQHFFFSIIVFTSHAFYLFAIIGFSIISPNYIAELQHWVKIYVALFLIWRFNFFRNVKFDELDKKIAFTAGMFLLTTTIVEKIVKYYLKEIKQIISMYI
jgi:hypothetical protein